jgi:hypothetical protein
MEDEKLNKIPVDSDRSNPSALKKPDDQGSVSVTAFVRIFDPKTNETIVETRA